MKTLAARIVLLAAIAGTILATGSGLSRWAYAEKGVRALYGTAVAEDYGVADRSPEERADLARHWHDSTIDMIGGISRPLMIVAAIALASLVANFVQATRVTHARDRTRTLHE
jgi:hypothetical protein